MLPCSSACSSLAISWSSNSNISRHEQDRVAGQHVRGCTGKLYVEDLPVGSGPQVAGFRVGRIRAVMNVIAARKQLVVEQVADLAIARGRLE